MTPLPSTPELYGTIAYKMMLAQNRLASFRTVWGMNGLEWCRTPLEPFVGQWYIEMARSRTPLYCKAFENGRVQLSYHPDTAIGVSASLEDFQHFFDLARHASLS